MTKQLFFFILAAFCLSACKAASASSDPDGDDLTFKWWFQEFVSKPVFPALAGGETPVATVTVPETMAGQVFHLVCEVHDNGPWHLPAYRRIILEVK